MATAAELVMAPSAARPETAGARKDAPASAGETSFAEVLDNEVQAAGDSDVAEAPAAVAAPAAALQVQPAPPPIATSAVELLISLQSADAPVAQPAISSTEGTSATPKAAPPVASVMTPVIAAAEPALAGATPAQAAAQQTDTTTALPQASTEISAPPQLAAANVATPAVVTTAPKAVQAVVDDAQDVPAAETGSEASSAESSSGVKATAVDADPAPVLVPALNSDAAAAPATAAPAQAVFAAVIVPAPKPAVSKTPETAEGTSPNMPAVAGRETPVAEPQAASPKTAADPGATSASRTPSNAVKPQTGVQTVAANAAPDVKTDAPAPASPNTSTSFADLMAARGASADAGKPATHPAMQGAPQAVVQVYTRFVERFDGRSQRFEVSLTPAELGRVDVRIEIGADKKVHAVLAAHDSAALTDLMRGQRALERALTDAGIDLKGGSVKFELANDSGRSLAGQEQRRDAWSGEDANVWRGFSAVDVAVEADAPVAVRSYRPAARLDLVA